MSPRLLVAAAALSAVVLSACGIPVDHAPRLLARSDLPGALVSGTSTTEVHEHGQMAEVRIFLVGAVGSNPVMRPVETLVPEANSMVSQAKAVLGALIAYLPSPRTSGLSNAIPSNVHILDASLQGDVLDLDLSQIDLSVQSTLLRLAFAQMVFTATDLDGIDFVRFSIEGAPIQVQIDSGTSSTGAAISQADYHQLAPSR
ncbi:MAG TPA: GerMN domain-containing protein [Acidimicrobiales bacterium]|nr:GerMN domain-containing protein [Acidimicrobiales bacterium]